MLPELQATAAYRTEKEQSEQASDKQEEQKVEDQKEQKQDAVKKSECPFRAGSKKAFLFKLLSTTPTALTRDEMIRHGQRSPGSFLVASPERDSRTVTTEELSEHIAAWKTNVLKVRPYVSSKAWLVLGSTFQIDPCMLRRSGDQSIHQGEAESPGGNRSCACRCPRSGQREMALAGRRDLLPLPASGIDGV